MTASQTSSKEAIICATFLADVLVAFSERYPKILLDFKLSNEQTDLVDTGFDVAVRAAAKLVDSTLVARKLGYIMHGLYASPAYFARRGVPTAPADLLTHEAVVFRAQDLVRT